jgi:hypothetical protein
MGSAPLGEICISAASGDIFLPIKAKTPTSSQSESSAMKPDRTLALVRRVYEEVHLALWAAGTAFVICFAVFVAPKLLEIRAAAERLRLHDIANEKRGLLREVAHGIGDVDAQPVPLRTSRSCAPGSKIALTMDSTSEPPSRHGVKRILLRLLTAEIGTLLPKRMSALSAAISA